MDIFEKFTDKYKKMRKSKESTDSIDTNDLKKIFILNELKSNDQFLKILLSYCYVETVAEGKFLYSEGDPSGHMYIVLDGTVRIYRRSSAGEPFLLAELTGSSGGFFGEIGLVLQQPRTATVQAETDVKLLVLSQKKFIQLTKQQPSIAIGLTFSICRILGERLERCNTDLAYLCDVLAREASEG